MSSSAPLRRQTILRHGVVVRICHWINLFCVVGLLMSGLQIFNATPALYWGPYSDFSRPLLALVAETGHDGKPRGITEVAGHRFDTTGVLGLSQGPFGQPLARGFPSWATLPGPQWLAMGRRWHFFLAWLFVANGLVYLASGLISGHFRRDLLPTHRDLRHIGQTLGHHLLLRFPKGEEAKHYNVLQKLAYLTVIGIFLLIALAGLTMSPGLDSAFPLVGLFGGRQTARTVHFILAAALVAFVLVHVLMVVLSGFLNNLRSMISGRYVIEEEASDGHAD